MEEKIAIVGAGLSGLLACKYIASKGFCPIVFESKDNIGGVWLKTIKSTKLQTPKSAYQFSDFPWPSSVQDEFPNTHQVFDYIQSYAKHFDLLKYINFSARVVGVDYDGPNHDDMLCWDLWGGNGFPFSSKGKWKLVVEDTRTLSTQEYKVDFVILCVGQFSEIPKIPEFPKGKGPEAFEGEVIHSKDYSAMDYESAAKFVKSKRVTVVGLQKSALDISMECCAQNGVEYPCTVLYKSEHWNLPDYLPWGIPLAFFYFNRFSELLIHKPGEGFFLSFLASFLSPLRWVFSKLVEAHIKRKLPMEKYGMVPKVSFLDDLSSCLISSLPDNFYDKVEMGSLVLKKSKSFSFCKDGIIVEDEVEPIKADLVILATGFSGDKKLREIFISPFFQQCLDSNPNSPLLLYRKCIHPRIPQLAIIGYSESVANLYTSEMRSKWVAELVDGTLKLPSIKEMEKQESKWDEYMKKCGQPSRRPCIGALHIWYNDQLCKDMGWNPKRKNGFFAEYFQPYGPSDYASSP